MVIAGWGLTFHGFVASALTCTVRVGVGIPLRGRIPCHEFGFSNAFSWLAALICILVYEHIIGKGLYS